MAACPIRLRVALIFSSAPAGCLRHNQEIDSGTPNQTTGKSTALRIGGELEHHAPVMGLEQLRNQQRTKDVAEWITDGHQRHPQVAQAIVGKFR